MATVRASVVDIRPCQLGQPGEQLGRRAQAESSKCRFLPSQVAWWPSLFFPTQNG